MNYSRREFLKRSTAVSGALAASSITGSVSSCSIMPRPRIPGEFLSGPVEASLMRGLLAPNSHNVQPWKIELKPNSTNDFETKRAYLYVDRERMLPETDPPGRQIYISQGTFLECVLVGSGLFGNSPQIRLFPERSGEGAKPVAALEFSEPPIVDPLASALDQRATVRTSYESPDRSEYFEAVKRAGKMFHMVRFFSPDHGGIAIQPERSNSESGLISSETNRTFQNFSVSSNFIQEIQNLCIEAFAIETNTPGAYEETRQWFRYNDREIYQKRDGISFRGNGVSGLRYFLARNLFLRRGRESWHAEENRRAGIEMFSDSVKSSDTYGLIISSNNRPEDWIHAGQDYVRLELAAQSLGLSFHPLSQALQEYPEMHDVKNRMEKLLGLRRPAKVQMLFRIGKSNYGFKAPRRALSSFLI